MSALLDSLTAAFDTLPLREAGGLGPARREALEALRRDGLPGARVEAWKYTSLRPLERRSFAAANEAQAFDAAWVASIPAPRIVFVNGVFAGELSDLSTLETGVTVEPLSAVLARGDSRECNVLGRRFERADEPFARLNAALATEGAIVRVDAGVQAKHALHLVTIGAPTGTEVASHLRHLVDLHQGARLEIVEHLISAGLHANLATSIVHAHLKPEAQLVHARLQDEAGGAQLFARTDAVLARDAVYRRLDLELGAGLSRHELNVALHGDRACTNANGVLLGDARRHLDTRLGIDHVGRDGRCELVWRGLASGRSRAAFHGGIEIREGADGTNAALSNKNLLLSDAAEIDSQPVLVIHADEVQAAHGATVGQLDPTSLFYLRSRGIPSNEARALLTAAFCRETLAVLDDGATRDLLAARLDAALARMESP
ncbi:Fe-S cluster assembly protein SufD [Lysobacter sp. TY2-98]|uniref:Fe-S cluster assembly protein SufD n=1 Tax=Lysobacter sp. TY2-98 TaxID=2290922 RepID=UPI000E205CC8|nr:Fe-S cluster assembly protein SufD [Lysobacter sp. TY2-98]AXK71427.1 Fe-S cluster assembly protein SufD [Lysobacter sp. TY2-98]